MYRSNMKFEVNPEAVISGIINGEIQARMCCKTKYPNDTENYKSELKKYREAGIVDSTPAIVSFIKNHPSVFRNSKLISTRNGNIFEEMITLTSQDGDYDESLKSRMAIVHDLTPEEMKEMDPFIEDFHSLETKPDVKEILSETKKYSRKIENLWINNETKIMSHIESILGYTPENIGKVKTYIMYPNYDTHRSCQVSENDTSLFFGKRGQDSDSKILAHLAHQAVHQPMLPYKIHMSKDEKDKLHCFIKFLTDKEIFSKFSGESGLKILTPQENYMLMGKIYPYWLGYKYRNSAKQGLIPEKEIEKQIKEDKSYFDSLPENSKLRKNYSYYHFDQLDPSKIAEFFRFKKGITPYEFVKIDFDNRENVCKKGMEISRNSRNLEELYR